MTIGLAAATIAGPAMTVLLELQVSTALTVVRVLAGASYAGAACLAARSGKRYRIYPYNEGVAPR